MRIFLSVFVVLLLMLSSSCNKTPGKLVTESFPNGREKSTIEFLGDTSHVQRRVDFFETGDTAKIAEFDVDGVTMIKEVVYYPNGEIRQSGAFIDGERLGVWKAFFETGQLQSIRNYNDQGLEEGLSRVYKLEGGHYYLFISGYFSEGVKRGTWKFFNRNGDTIKTLNH